jgi:membrane protein DedA with SNARE-associated domain/membrane-associated phospholipid phosphatase
MLEQIMKITVSYIHHHHNIGVLIAAFISCLESLAIVGSIIPGSITMTIIGSLIGSGILDAKITVGAIFIGGMIGDYISFWFGHYYKDDIKNFKIIKKYEKIFLRGEEFIQKQGAKSIVIGRFFGPMRSMIPMIAGILAMPRTKFILAAIPSVALWEICYLTPGIILGAFAIELPPNAAFKFIIFVLSFFILLTLLIWLIRQVCIVISTAQHAIATNLWEHLLRHKAYFFKKYIADHPLGHLQIIKLAYLLVMASLVTIILFYLHYHHNILNIDPQIKSLMTNIYNPVVYKVMLAIGYLGDKFVIFPTIGIMVLYLTFHKAIKLRLYLISITITAAATIGLTKHIFGRIRPMPETTIFLENFSFPSGHILLSTALLCFIMTIICHNKKSIARVSYYQLTSLFLCCITFARIYIGAHWFSDVLVSSIIGFIIASIYSFFYYRKYTNSAIMPVIKVGCIAYGIFWLSYTAMFLSHDSAKHKPLEYQVKHITSHEWHQNQNIDTVRNNIFGMPISPLNMQWVGDKKTITQQLLANNWREHKVEPTFFNRFIHMLSESNLSVKPLFSQKYHNKAPAMIFSYHTGAKEEIILKLWESDIILDDAAKPMWLGSVYLNNLHTQIFSNKKDHSNNFNMLTKFKQNSRVQPSPLNMQLIPTQNKDNNFIMWDHNIIQVNFVNHTNGDKHE